MARLIKSDYVQMEKAVVIGNDDVKEENKQALQTSSNLKEMMEESQEINDEQIKIEKLTQLKERLQIEAEELNKNSKQLANEILEDANRKSRQIVDDAIKKSSELLDEKANEGFQQGYQDAIEKYDKIIKQAQDVLKEASEYKKKVYQSQEKEIIDLVLRCVNKIIRDKLDRDDTTVTNIISSSIDDINNKKNLTVKISSEDFEQTTKLRNMILASYPSIEDVEIKIIDSYKKGDIEIESDEGTVNPSVKAQILKLKDEFYKLLEGD